MGGSPVLVPYAAYLRVYEPLAAFPEPERSHWYRYAAEGAARTAQDELRQSLAGLVPVPPIAVPVHESADAFVAVVGGVTHICPWRTRLRGWLALERTGELVPEPVLDAMLPPVVRRQAAADHEAWRERNPDARPWIRTATWHVPVRWFVLVGDDEREYEPAGAGESKEPLLRYRTPMVQARRRVARGLRVLKDALDDGGPLVDGLIDVGRWLEEFHPRSLVELDYGDLVHLLDDAELAQDESARDMAAALRWLAAGDGDEAAAVYSRMAARMKALQAVEAAN